MEDSDGVPSSKFPPGSASQAPTAAGLGEMTLGTASQARLSSIFRQQPVSPRPPLLLQSGSALMCGRVVGFSNKHTDTFLNQHIGIFIVDQAPNKIQRVPRCQSKTCRVEVTVTLCHVLCAHHGVLQWQPKGESKGHTSWSGMIKGSLS